MSQMFAISQEEATEASACVSGQKTYVRNIGRQLCLWGEATLQAASKAQTADSKGKWKVR